jgi:two-component system NtrC family sensor kinase
MEGFVSPSGGVALKLTRIFKHGFSEVKPLQPFTFKSFVYRPVWLPVAITVVLLLLALAMLFVTAWRGMDRLHPMQKHLERMTETQSIFLHTQRVWLDHLHQGTEIPAQALAGLRNDIADLLNNANPDDEPEVIAAQRRAYQMLGNQEIPRSQAIIGALTQLGRALKSETLTHSTMVNDATDNAEFELGIATVTMLVLPSLGLVILFMVRKRILVPLNNLGWLMSQLARRDYITAPTQDIDPVLEPLIDNYNHMVTRLAELEREHKARHDSLELQVRSAASSLLEQQRNLAKAEQLAAVGELAARLAHELRNPLAGMHMALQNLQHEVTSDEQVERIVLISNELERITTLLNSLLDQAKHRPEPMRDVNLSQVAGELLKLARFQLPENISVTLDIPKTLECRLPENSLRRALLNLILNSYHAIGDKAGDIRISARQQEDGLLIEVCDDGPGFPPAILESSPRAFQTTRPGGTGLGLTTVQNFVQELHGTLSLHNLEPHGACAKLNIPIGSTHA